MDMTETDDKQIEQFLSAGRREIADNGFSRRVMRHLPDRRERFVLWWTRLGFTLALVLFIALDGIQLLWNALREAVTSMVEQGMAADVDPTNPGWEMWSSASRSMRDFRGDSIAVKPASQNFAVWWDGDLSRELLDGNHIDKFNPETRLVENLVTFEGATSNNGTKSNPAISGDLLGDWREEVLLRAEDNSELRLYVSTIPTKYRFHTFLEDPVYRTSLATENVCYNQPPEVGFYFGSELNGKFRGTTVKGPKVKPAVLLEDVLLDSVLFEQRPRMPRPRGPQMPQRPLAQDESVVDNTPDSLDLAKTARPVAGSSRKGDNPVLFLVGDSTMRTGTRGNGDNGQWGWGYYAHEFFDEVYWPVYAVPESGHGNLP